MNTFSSRLVLTAAVFAAGCSTAVADSGSAGSGGAPSSAAATSSSSNEAGDSATISGPACGPVVDAAAPSSDVATLWSRQLGTLPTYYDPTALAADGEGRILVGGIFQSALDLGGGAALTAADDGLHRFVAALAPSGDALWARLETEADFVGAIYSGPSGAFFLTSGDAAKTTVFARDAAGAPLWNRTFHLFDPVPVAPQEDGTSLVAGTLLGGPFDYGSGTLERAAGAGMDPVVMRLDASGEVLWARTLAGAVWPAPPAAEHWLLLEDFVAAPGGGAFALAIASTDGAGGAQLLFRLDAAGAITWIRAFPGAEADLHARLSAGADGRVLVYATPGYPINSVDLGCGPVEAGFVIAMTAPDGTPLWTRMFSGNASFRTAHIDAQGSVVLAGFVRYPCDLGAGPLVDEGNAGEEMAVVRFGPDGVLHESPVITKAHTGAASLSVTAVDPAGNLILGGSYSAKLDLGAGRMPESADTVMYLARVKP